jgi:hypothetical protein
VGFNSMQPGKVKRADVVLFTVGIAVIVALFVWAMVG